jgi:hypothetical protein
MSSILLHPVYIIAFFSSSVSNDNTFSTPFYPPEARPHNTGLPIKIALAPRARAFKISVPLLTPPSKKIGIFLSLALTAVTISSSTSIVAKVVSNYLPPWLETKIPSAPFSRASRASSLHIIPLAMTGSPESF